MAGRKSGSGMQDSPIFRLSGMLRERKEEMKSFLALADAINDANGNPSPPVIDRRKLAKIVKGEDLDVSLSVKELIALDRYLERFNQSLAQHPILEKPSILDTLTKGERIAFLLGARAREDRVDLSNWDVEAMAEILRDAGGFRQVRFDIQAVLLEQTEKEVRAAGRGERSLWRKLLAKDGPSLVCCGSPRSCHAAEVMLSLMFGVEPFEPAFGRHPPLPFHFVWGPGSQHEITCRSAYTASDLDSMRNPAVREVLEGRAHVLLVGDETFVAAQPGSGPRQTSYGVIVAQRQEAGQVWMVVAGLTGAATHAVARCTKDIHTNLPPEGKGSQKSRTVWAVVKATAEREQGRASTRIRRVTDQEIIGGLRLHPGI